MTFIKKTDKSYEIGIQDAKVKIGGKDPFRFVPNINCNKWSDEAWLNLNHKRTVVKSEEDVYDSSSNNITLDVNGTQHRYYIDDSGNLEYEYILPIRPENNSIDFDLTFAPGLTFHKQPSLEEEYDTFPQSFQESLGSKENYIANNHRPENVIHSYAVYFNKRNGKYKTGKFCHIYRPLITDANGDTIWGELSFPDNLLRISIDSAWLDQASYPIVVDPTLGYDTKGSLLGSGGGTHTWAVHDTSGGTAGTCDTIHVYAEQNGEGDGYVRLGLYSDDVGNNRPEDLQATAVQILLPDPYDAELSIAYTPAIAASTKYWVAGHTGPTSGHRIRYDSGGPTNKSARTAQTTLPDPWENANDNFSVYISLWISYTEGGVELVVADSYQLQVTESPGLIMTLIPADSYQLQITEIPNLIMELIPVETYQAQVTEIPNLIMTLIPVETYQLQVTETVTLITTPLLVVADSCQLQITEVPNLIMTLIVTDTYQLQVTETITLTVSGLNVTDTYQAQFSDTVNISGVIDPITVDIVFRTPNISITLTST